MAHLLIVDASKTNVHAAARAVEIGHEVTFVDTEEAPSSISRLYSGRRRSVTMKG